MLASATRRCARSRPAARWRAYASGSDARAPVDAAADKAPPEGPAPDAPPWPCAPQPSPYDVLAMRPDAPYSKRRFCQLAKLYHPDTEAHQARGLTRAARLERYRLVVAAHHLLRDPVRRRLYDAHGTGWPGAPRVWPNSAAQNATWEDWERWRGGAGGRPQAPTYMSNGAFAALVALLCVVAALAQAGRAEAVAAERDRRRHAAIGHDVHRTAQAAAGRSKDERVDSFLRDRENVAYDYVPARYEEAPQAQRPP